MHLGNIKQFHKKNSVSQEKSTECLGNGIHAKKQRNIFQKLSKMYGSQNAHKQIIIIIIFVFLE